MASVIFISKLCYNLAVIAKVIYFLGVQVQRF